MVAWGRRGFNLGSSVSKPVEIGKEYEVDITEVSRKGDGFARIGFRSFLVYNRF